jgi:hypothetical protein
VPLRAYAGGHEPDAAAIASNLRVRRRSTVACPAVTPRHTEATDRPADAERMRISATI